MKILISFLTIIAIVFAQNQQTTTDDDHFKCSADQTCSSNCCLFGQCMPNELFCQSQAFKEVKVDDLKKQFNTETGSAFTCDANWQCSSNCCFLGDCRESNFMCKNDKGFGERCSFNSDCNSGCCNNYQCSSYWQCHVGVAEQEITEEQLQTYHENEMETGFCGANWQCPSNCCFMGSCKKSNFLCKNERNLGDKCNLDDDCNSGCCKFGFCSSFFACKFQEMGVSGAQMKEYEENELDVETASHCDANWQCPSNCCFLGSCKKSNFMCQNDKNIGDKCAFDDDCNSGCCKSRFCSSYFACHYQGTTNQNSTDIAEIKALQQKEASLQLKNQVCGMNWQCSSGCCYHGLCSDQTIMCRNQGELGDACQDDNSCNSGCCVYGLCNPFQLCKVTQSQERSELQNIEKFHTQEYLTHIKQQVTKAKNEIGLQATELWGPCDYNFQCSSSCCLEGTCSLFQFSCGDQNATGDVCQKNQDCLSSCCYDDGFTNEKKCSPIEFCTYEKKHSFQHDCKWNAECQSGCCAFGSCRKDMFWCNGQVEEGQDCVFDGDCRSSCCTQGKCSYAMNCYTGKDFLRESDPELMVFYDYLLKFGSTQKASFEHETKLAMDLQLNLPETHYNLTMKNSNNERPWFLYVGVVFGVALIILVVALIIRNRNKILNICKRRKSMEYSRLIEEEVVGRDRL